jgi:hypothetical protein
MAKDAGQDLGYHWRRAAGVYDTPGAKTKGDADTTSSSLAGLGAPQAAKAEPKKK